MNSNIKLNRPFLFNLTFTSLNVVGVYSGVGIKVNPGETIVKKASEIGDPTNTFLNVTNMDADDQGYYSVTVL